MPNIKNINKMYSGRTVMTSAARTVIPKVEQLKFEPIEKEFSSIFDLSTEELGFFMHGDKMVQIIFPR